jgi:hypothetical protein
MTAVHDSPPSRQPPGWPTKISCDTPRGVFLILRMQLGIELFCVNDDKLQQDFRHRKIESKTETTRLNFMPANKAFLCHHTLAFYFLKFQPAT